MEVLISKALSDTYINHGQFYQSIKIKEYNCMKDEIKKSWKWCRTFYIKKETYCVSCKKNIKNKNSGVRRIKQKRLMLVSNFCTCGNIKDLLKVH